MCKPSLGGSMLYWIYLDQLELTCQTYDLWTLVGSIIFFYLYIKKYKTNSKSIKYWMIKLKKKN